MAEEEPDTMREDIEKSWDEQLSDWVKKKLKSSPGGKQKKKIDDILSQDPYAPKPPKEE